MRSLVVLLAGLCLGCGLLQKARNSIAGSGEPSVDLPENGGVPRHLLAGRSQSEFTVRKAYVGQDPAVIESQAGGGGSSGPGLLTPEEDIVWTDPDNPDAALPGLEDIIRANKKRGSWEESYTIARKRAQREGKPLLMWFTDSRRSAVCKKLSSELFATADFDSWAEDNVVRLRLDFDVKRGGGGDLQDQMDTEARKKDYLESLEKRFNARGKPHVLVLAPDGATMLRQRGYKPDSSEFYWGKLKHAAIVAQRHYGDWKEGLEKKGYRDWESRGSDFKIFAKLVRYREGELILVEPDGKRFTTKESNLSEGDRLWIAGEKARRR